MTEAPRSVADDGAFAWWPYSRLTLYLVCAFLLCLAALCLVFACFYYRRSRRHKAAAALGDNGSKRHSGAAGGASARHRRGTRSSRPTSARHGRARGASLLEPAHVATGDGGTENVYAAAHNIMQSPFQRESFYSRPVPDVYNALPDTAAANGAQQQQQQYATAGHYGTTNLAGAAEASGEYADQRFFTAGSAELQRNVYSPAANQMNTMQTLCEIVKTNFFIFIFIF